MKIIYSVAVLVLLFNLTGCYTVIWSPGMDSTIPSDTYAYDDSTYNGNSDYSGSNNGDSSYNVNSDNNSVMITNDYFYDPHYYGAYAQYYHHPWWLSYLGPKSNNDAHKNQVNKTGSGTSTGTVRNTGEGRGDYGRNTGGSTGTIINNAPPAVNTSGSTGSGSTSSTGTRQSTTSNTDNKSNNNDNSSNRNSGSGSVRNNDGNRNDGGRK